MKDLRLGLLFKELLLFSLVPVIGLSIASIYYSLVDVEKMSVGSSVPLILVYFAAAIVLVLVIIKFIKIKFPYQVLMSLVIFTGSFIVFDALVTSLYAAIIAALLIALYWLAKNIMVHNLVIIIAVSGVAIYLGLVLPVAAVLILFGVLAVYDVIAVLKTGHMVEMFKSMAERGAVLALMIPEKLSYAKKKVSKVNVRAAKRGVVFLGTGDAAFPTMLAVAALHSDLYSAIGVTVGALVGLVGVHFLLLKFKRALPALPPIAVGSSLGYLVGALI